MSVNSILASYSSAPTFIPTPGSSKTLYKLTLPISSPTGYYIVPAPPPRATVAVTPVWGSATSTTGSQDVSFSLPNLSTGSYTLLIFAQNLQPFLLPLS